MAKRRILIDCDPGLDDAVNLLVAFASPDEFDIVGVTAVAGNVTAALTTRNACIVRDLAGRPDVPVYAGCERPMVVKPRYAAHVHGESGMDGMELFEPSRGPEPGHAVDFIIEAARAAGPDGLTLVPTGPLTNIALAIIKAPDILANIDEIVLMGGAMREGGNLSPSAEFNMVADPHAAYVVFACGRPITAFGLDATHQALCTPERAARMCAHGGRAAEAVRGMMAFSIAANSRHYGIEGAPLHDPCTIAYLLRPEVFTAKFCNVVVEIASSLTLGHTAVDFWGVTGRPPNTRWVHAVDADALFDLFTERLARL